MLKRDGALYNPSRLFGRGATTELFPGGDRKWEKQLA